MSDLDPIQEANIKFEQACQDRHNMGAEKYGEDTYLDKDTLAMAQDELIDLANYARYSFIKLELMRQGIMDWTGNGVGIPLPGTEMMGKNAVFQPVVPKQRRGE